jgi:hypothetical protein
MPKPSRYIVFLAISAGLLLAACGGPSVPTATAGTAIAPATEAELTAIPPSSSAPTDAPTDAPSATPTATSTPLPTPGAITIDVADRFQVIREIYSPELSMKTFVLAVSPDARMAAVGGCEPEADGSCYTRTVLRLIDIDTGATLFNLEPLAPVIDVLAFSPDGSSLAIAACDLPLYLVGEMDTICDGRRLWSTPAANQLSGRRRRRSPARSQASRVTQKPTKKNAVWNRLQKASPAARPLSTARSAGRGAPSPGGLVPPSRRCHSPSDASSQMQENASLEWRTSRAGRNHIAPTERRPHESRAGAAAS